MSSDDIDLANPDLYVNGVPHEVFTRLRRADPVHWNPQPDGRLAELQLRIFFGEFLKRYPNAAPFGPIKRMRSNFVAGIKEMPVRLR